MQNIKLDDKKVYIPKFTEGIKAKIHRKLDSNYIIKQAFISKIADECYIVINYENNKTLPKPKVIKNPVGLDMDLENFIIRSDRVIYKNHKFLQDKENKLIKLQRQLSKKQKGSNNRIKAKLKAVKAHQKLQELKMIICIR